MAVTKIHGIKTTVNKAIEYICNPDKTDQNLYIVVSLESQIRHLREMLKYAEQYQKNKIYDDHYKNS